MTWKLQAITGEFTGQEISIERDMLVGRDQDAEILLQLKDISRKHAALLFRDDHVWVKDLKSTNGTFVNGERVEHEQEIELHDGDMLQFASFIFMILAPERYKADLPEIEVEPVAATNHDAGMPTLAERAAETSINRDGMPQQVGIPNQHQFLKVLMFMLLLNSSRSRLKNLFLVFNKKLNSKKMHRLV